MFRKEHRIPVAKDGERYFLEFTKVHGIPYMKEYREKDILFCMKMRRREFEALCEYLLNLNKVGVFPTIL